MGQSGNPANRAKKVSSAADFKKLKKGQIKELPSGLVVRLRKVELQSLILKNALPNPLMEMVSEALEKGQKADVAKMVGVDEGKLDLNLVNDMYETLNSLVCTAILEPQVLPVPTQDDVIVHNEEHPDDAVTDPEELRNDELLYVDEIEELDKMFIFQWLTGGTDDLETFRREAGADLDALAKMQGNSSSTQ